MKLVYIGSLELWKNAPDHLGIKQGLEDLGIDYKIIDHNFKQSRVIAKEIVDFDPDLVIYGETTPVTQGIPSLVRQHKNIKSVFWMLDYKPFDTGYDGEFNIWLSQKEGLDAIFLSNKGQIEQWNKEFDLPVHYLPHACYISNPKSLIYYEYDCIFIGSKVEKGFLAERAKLLYKIMEIQPFVWLNEEDVEERNKLWDLMPTVYYSSKKVLDVSHYWDNAGYCSGRYWYIPAYGGYSVTKRFPDCEELFPEPYKMYFDTPQEAGKLIRKKPEISRKEIMEYAHTKHSYMVRFKEMFNKL